MTYAELVARLTQLRIAKGLSRAKLAKKMHSSKSYVWRLEAMQAHATPQMLTRWCEALDAKLRYILLED